MANPPTSATGAAPAPTHGTTAAAPPLSPAALQAAARALGTGGAGATRLLALLVDPDTDTWQILSGLRSEPALAARVLKVANSPFYGRSGQVGTLDHAVQLLGLSAVRGVAAAGCLDRVMPARSGRAFDPERFRRHSLAVAWAAQQLATASGLDLPGEAFMAGLLHDIGVLVLIKAAPAAMQRFEPLPADHPAAALDHERLTLGTSHDACATALAEAWQWPVWLQRAVAHHHQADSAGSSRDLSALPQLVAVADQLADRAGLGFWPLCALATQPTAGASLALDPAALDSVTAGLPGAVAALSDTAGR